MDHARPTRDRREEMAAEKEPSHAPNRRPQLAGPRSRDSAHLGTLSKRKPARKSAQVRWLWPEIRAALAAGHSIGDVRQELALDGIEISYSKLRTYVAQLRKAHPREAPVYCVPEPSVAASNGPTVEIPPSARPTGPTLSSVIPPVYDALANLRERLTRRPGFQYDDRPPDEKKLI
jgi:hypothetical protein